MAVWSEIALSQVAAACRLDAEYFRPEYLALLDALEMKNPSRIKQFAFVTDGIHASPDVVDEGGVPYLSAKCVKDNEFAVQDTLQISTEQHNANKRTQLRRDDVLVTTVGTIGNAAVVTDELLPANADRHLGIIRIKKDSGFDPYYLATFLNTRLGRFQTLREATGNVQLNLFIDKIKMLRVVQIADHARVADLARQAYARRRDAEQLYSQAEMLLESALGSNRLDLTPKLVYERMYADVQAASRFDAEYFNPRMQNLIATLSSQSLTIADVAKLANRRFKPTPASKFQYIEIADVTGSGTADSNPVAPPKCGGRSRSYRAPSLSRHRTHLFTPCLLIRITERLPLVLRGFRMRSSEGSSAHNTPHAKTWQCFGAS